MHFIVLLAYKYVALNFTKKKYAYDSRKFISIANFFHLLLFLASPTDRVWATPPWRDVCVPLWYSYIWFHHWRGLSCVIIPNQTPLWHCSEEIQRSFQTHLCMYIIIFCVCQYNKSDMTGLWFTSFETSLVHKIF